MFAPPWVTAHCLSPRSALSHLAPLPVCPGAQCSGGSTSAIWHLLISAESPCMPQPSEGSYLNYTDIIWHMLTSHSSPVFLGQAKGAVSPDISLISPSATEWHLLISPDISLISWGPTEWRLLISPDILHPYFIPYFNDLEFFFCCFFCFIANLVLQKIRSFWGKFVLPKIWMVKRKLYFACMPVISWHLEPLFVFIEPSAVEKAAPRKISWHFSLFSPQHILAFCEGTSPSHVWS